MFNTVVCQLLLATQFVLRPLTK